MGNTNLIVFKGAKHKAEAKAFVSYLMKDENYLRYVLTDPSAFGPVTKSAQESAAYKDSPQLKAVREVVDAVFAELPNAWVYGMPNPHAGEIEGLNILSDSVARVVLENISPEAAAKDGAARISRSSGSSNQTD